MQPAIKSILKYPGAKWNCANWIISHFPAHKHYVEPFFGSGAVFFNKQPAKHEVINDLSGDVVNLFRVIRDQGEQLAALIEMTPWAREEYESSYEQTDDPLERARRFVVRSWQAHNGDLGEHVGWAVGGVSSPTNRRIPLWRQVPNRIESLIERLIEAEIKNRLALDIVQRNNGHDVLIYADPPYPHITRTKKGKAGLYQHEMTDADHLELLDALDAHLGPVVLSGYHCALYANRLSHWRTVEKQVQAEKGNSRIEVLWLNKYINQQLTLFDLIS